MFGRLIWTPTLGSYRNGTSNSYYLWLLVSVSKLGAGGGGEFLWLVLLPVAHGVPSYVGLAGKLEGLGAGRYRVSQQAGMPAIGLGGRDAPASPGESRWRVGPGFGWGLG